MNRVTGLLYSLAFVFSLGIPTEAAVASSRKTPEAKLRDMSPNPEVLVLAHRGCWGEAPEVSVAAIKACETVGADAVEVDVRRTRDGVLVLMHDDRVDRTTNGTGVVADMTAAQVRALRLRTGGGGPNAALTDEHVPTLEEGLKAAKGKFIVNLHLKAPVEREVAELVRRLDMVGQVTAWIGSRPADAQLANSPMRGSIGLIPIIAECRVPGANPCWSRPVGSLASYALYQPVAFFISHENSHEFIREVAAAERPAGSRIFVSSLWRVDELPRDARRAEWRRLIDLGANIIMTDYPADLIDFLRTARSDLRSGRAARGASGGAPPAGNSGLEGGRRHSR